MSRYVRRSVGWTDGQQVDRWLCHDFLKGWEVSLPCSYRSTSFDEIFSPLITGILIIQPNSSLYFHQQRLGGRGHSFDYSQIYSQIKQRFIFSIRIATVHLFMYRASLTPIFIFLEHEPLDKKVVDGQVYKQSLFLIKHLFTSI